MTRLLDVNALLALGFSAHPDHVKTEASKRVLAALTGSPRFIRLTDDLGADSLPAYVKKAAEVTDGHLLALAKRHGAKLATLDTGIPGAELIT